MKSGNLNFLEPSGPVQACNRTTLPLPFTPEGWVVIAISWLFYVQGRYLVPTVQEAGWAPQPVRTSKENIAPKRV